MDASTLNGQESTVVFHVLGLQRLHLSQVKKLFMAKENWGGAMLQEVAKGGDVEIWVAVVEIFKMHGMLEEVGSTRLKVSSECCT